MHDEDTVLDFVEQHLTHLQAPGANTTADTSATANQACAAALEKDGGMQRIAAFSEKSKALSQRINGRQTQTQSAAFVAVDMALLLQHNRQVKPEFDELVGVLVAQCTDLGLHIEASIPDNLKEEGRASTKARIKHGGDKSHLVDLVRGTLSAASIEDLYTMVEELEGLCNRHNNPECALVEFSDRFQEALSGGHRDMQIIVRVKGTCCELQLSTINFTNAKVQGGGHFEYSVKRWFAENILLAANDDETPRLHRLVAVASKLGFALAALMEQVADKAGFSALHYTALWNNVKSTLLLLKHGANSLRTSHLSGQLIKNYERPPFQNGAKIAI